MFLPTFHDGLSPSRSIQSSGSTRVGAWGHGNPIAIPFLSETDAEPLDQDDEDAEEERVQKEIDCLAIPLEAPWTKTVPSIWDSTLRREPSREKLLGADDRLSRVYWSLLETAAKQRRDGIVPLPTVMATVRQAIAHDPKNP